MGMFIWASAGILLATAFAFLQRASIDHASSVDAQKLLSNTLLQSGVRILLSVIFLYFSFSASIQAGLAYLVGYLLARWISLFILAGRIKS